MYKSPWDERHFNRRESTARPWAEVGYNYSAKPSFPSVVLLLFVLSDSTGGAVVVVLRRYFPVLSALRTVKVSIVFGARAL